MSKKGKRSIAAKRVIEEIERELDIDDLHDEPNSYEFSIEWEGTNFHFTMRDVKARFYGWYRKSQIRTEGVMYCVDIFVKYTPTEGPAIDLSVDSIVYNHDPRKAMKSLNADIGAAANKWLFSKLHGNFNTIDQLHRQATQPTIHVKRIGTIDMIIMKLKECRDTAIRCGGSRIVQLTGDTDSTPINIAINVTAQAMALEGKVPSLEMGGMMDRVLTGEPSIVKGGGGRSTGMTKNIPEASNVRALVDMLKSTKDKDQARKIRATLRRMGHKGGSRSIGGKEEK